MTTWSTPVKKFKIPARSGEPLYRANDPYSWSPLATHLFTLLRVISLLGKDGWLELFKRLTRSLFVSLGNLKTKIENVCTLRANLRRHVHSSVTRRRCLVSLSVTWRRRLVTLSALGAGGFPRLVYLIWS